MKIASRQTNYPLLGTILLIAGSCIGAGMLGLPVASAASGFKPSLMMFFLSWLFMATTGLLLLEVNLWFNREVNIISMVEATLGIIGKISTWFLFLFLFYSIMVAYASGSGELFTDFVEELTGSVIPAWVGSVGFVSLFALMIYYGTFAVDQLNRLLMSGLVISYFLLIGFGFDHVQAKLLAHTNWDHALWALPVMIISFGYHNLVPSLTTYMQFDAKKMRLAIIIGSAIPLASYLVWEGVIMGIIPADSFQAATSSGEMVTRTLKNTLGAAWIVDVAQYFAFFAIVTSFLGVALSFVDFLADGLSVEKTPKGKLFLTALALGPPLLFALLFPGLFVTALEYAGGFGAVILFGVIPALMVWVGRYRLKLWTSYQVPGGKPILLLVIAFAITVFLVQCISVFHA